MSTTALALPGVDSVVPTRQHPRRKRPRAQLTDTQTRRPKAARHTRLNLQINETGGGLRDRVLVPPPPRPRRPMDREPGPVGVAGAVIARAGTAGRRRPAPPTRTGDLGARGAGPPGPITDAAGCRAAGGAAAAARTAAVAGI